MTQLQLLDELSAAVLSIAERVAEGKKWKLDQSVRIILIRAIEDAILSGYYRQQLLEAFSKDLDLLTDEEKNAIYCIKSHRLPDAGRVIEKGVATLTDDQLSCLAVKPMMIEQIADELTAKHYKPGLWFQKARQRHGR